MSIKTKVTALAKGAKGLAKRAGFAVKKASPEILLVVGVGGTVTTVVVACKATKKVAPVMEEHQQTMEQIHKVHESDEYARWRELNDYDEKSYRRDLTIAYVNTGKKFVKIYAPSVGILVASIGCIVGSHSIMKSRYAAVSAALSASLANYDKLYENVKEKYGEKEADELAHGKMIIDDEEALAAYVDGMLSTCNTDRCFDEYNPHFKKSSDRNRITLQSLQSWANEELRLNRYLTLNQVYTKLGYDVTEEGQFLGWIYDPTCHQLHNFVSFGVFDNPEAESFLAGDEAAVWLHFNYDGNILSDLRKVQCTKY